MQNVYVSRYLYRSLPEVVAALTATPPPWDAPVPCDTGPAQRIHGTMWVVPVSWRRGPTPVLEGQLRVIAVASGGHPISEVLLTGDLADAEAEAIDPDELLDDLVALVEVPEAALDKPTSGVRTWTRRRRAHRRGAKADRRKTLATV
jgi:hypothetical protein